MKTKQTKGAQAEENQEANVNADQLMYGSRRRKPSQSHKIISLYHHRQKKEEDEKAKDSREVNSSQARKEGREAEGSRGTKDSRETRKGREAEENREMENSRELCVVCGRETEYVRETPISRRRGYIEGAGQLCRRCFAEIYADGQ